MASSQGAIQASIAEGATRFGWYWLGRWSDASAGGLAGGVAAQPLRAIASAEQQGSNRRMTIS
jgi:hypothetical protein